MEYPGRILIMTSNYPERLDKALTRKGRIDLSLNMKKASRAIVEEMYENFYDTEWPRDDATRAAEDYKHTPAEVSAILYDNFDTPELALVELTTVAEEEEPPDKKPRVDRSQEDKPLDFEPVGMNMWEAERRFKQHDRNIIVHSYRDGTLLNTLCVYNSANLFYDPVTQNVVRYEWVGPSPGQLY